MPHPQNKNYFPYSFSTAVQLHKQCGSSNADRSSPAVVTAFNKPFSRKVCFIFLVSLKYWNGTKPCLHVKGRAGLFEVEVQALRIGKRQKTDLKMSEKTKLYSSNQVSELYFPYLSIFIGYARPIGEEEFNSPVSSKLGMLHGNRAFYYVTQ